MPTSFLRVDMNKGAMGAVVIGFLKGLVWGLSTKVLHWLASLQLILHVCNMTLPFWTGTC